MNVHSLVPSRLALQKPAMVIFDCDGVLIDSEPLTNRVVAEIISEAGWPMTEAECQRRFIGLSFHDTQPVVEARLGIGLGPDWVDRVVDRVVVALAAEVEPVAGARAALEATTALGLPWRIASNSSHQEMNAKFARAGLSSLVAGRVHSAVDVIARGGRGKPAPDIYLEAAATQGVAPASCLVIEDSVAGVRAAVAAGMTCLGFSPDHDGAHLQAEGAVPLHSLHALPDLLRAVLQKDAP
jgi:beta-phosphoglucomutase-like phosphatase (HAD superfamily)